LTNAKLTSQTGWKPKTDFEDGLAITIDWYRNHQTWIQHVKSGEYRRFYELNYASRAQ
jgi:dTDP-glucose 4,6-dehydratase